MLAWHCGYQHRIHRHIPHIHLGRRLEGYLEMMHFAIELVCRYPHIQHQLTRLPRQRYVFGQGGIGICPAVYHLAVDSEVFALRGVEVGLMFQDRLVVDIAFPEIVIRLFIRFCLGTKQFSSYRRRADKGELIPLPVQAGYLVAATAQVYCLHDVQVLFGLIVGRNFTVLTGLRMNFLRKPRMLLRPLRHKQAHLLSFANPVTGTGRKLERHCPAFALRQHVRIIRAARQHNGRTHY